MYDSLGKREFVSYGDYVIDTVKYEIKGDTLMTALGQKYIILKINDTNLVMKDITRIWGVDTLKFVKSKDQKSYPM